MVTIVNIVENNQFYLGYRLMTDHPKIYNILIIGRANGEWADINYTIKLGNVWCVPHSACPSADIVI